MAVQVTRPEEQRSWNCKSKMQRQISGYAGRKALRHLQKNGLQWHARRPAEWSTRGLQNIELDLHERRHFEWNARDPWASCGNLRQSSGRTRHDTMTLRKQLFVVSSELKKQQKNYEASAAHGLRWTRGSRGGSLTGALHSMPAGVSSAKKKKPRAGRVS